MKYILSQVFVLLAYALLGLTYLIKNRKSIIVLSTLSTISFTVSYIFLAAWTGFAMNVVSLLRNLLFYLVARFAKNSKFWDYFTLFLIYVLLIICTIFTFDGVFSLMATVATIAYTFAIWSKKKNNYKIFGLISSLCWIVYNIFIRSILGVVFETVMVICAIIGLIKSIENKENNDKTENEQNEEKLSEEGK